MVVDGGFEVLKSTGVDLEGEVGGDGFFGKSVNQVMVKYFIIPKI